MDRRRLFSLLARASLTPFLPRARVSRLVNLIPSGYDPTWGRPGITLVAIDHIILTYYAY